MATSPEEVLRSLPNPPKNLPGKDGQIISSLVQMWVAECAGKCSVAELTQEQINNLFLLWLKKGRYQELVVNHLVKKLIKTPRPKQPAEVNQEMRARRVLNAAAKLHGRVAVITGSQMIEKGEKLGDSTLPMEEAWKQSGLKPRSVISEMVEEIQKQLRLEDNSSEDDEPIAAE